tara:strand:+ start:55237 stop:55455 length:219 start_codon:yes stop_codon:yes gene_type:complete
MEELLKKGWVLIFKSVDGTDAKIKKSKLSAAGIEVIAFDHQDSMMTSLNDTNFMVSLFVHQKDEASAKEILG